MFCSVSFSTEDFKSSSSISLFSSSVRTSYTGVHHVHGVKSVVGFNVVVVVVVPGVGNIIGGPTHHKFNNFQSDSVLIYLVVLTRKIKDSQMDLLPLHSIFCLWF